MATTAPKKKITDYFDSISNPSGGLSSLFKGTSAPSNKISQLLLQNSKPSALTPMMPATPAVAPSRSEALGGRAPAPVTSVVRNDAPSRSAALGGPAPVFSGSAVPRETAPVVPQPVAAPSTSEIPPQWLNADGSFKSPDQIASEMGATLRSSQGGGDVGALALGQFGGAEKTAEQLRAEALQLNNTRNDIAVGETDPYKVASKSGIAYTPAELNAIEKAYAGIYDPSLTTALAKVEQKQIEDEAARKEAAALASDERNNAFELTKMEKQFGYDKALKQIPTPGSGSSSSNPSGGYVQGADPVIDGWVDRILRTGEDLNKALPGVANTNLRSQVMLGLNSRRFEDARTSGTLTNVNSINQLLQNEDLSNISGFVDQLFGGHVGNAKDARVIYDNIIGNLQLDMAKKLQGQGAVSDFERSVLQKASTMIDRGQSDESFREALVGIRGAFMTSSGLEAPVRITDPSSGQSEVQQLTSQEITDFIRDGAIIEYVEI